MAKKRDRGELVSLLDVLERYFQGMPDLDAIRALKLAQVDELGELVKSTAELLAGTRGGDDGLGELVYPGGWLAKGWSDELFRTEMNALLLYEPRLLIHDPLAEYFFSEFDRLPKMRTLNGHGGTAVYGGPDLWANHGRRVHRGEDIEGIRSDLVRIFKFLAQVEPLIRSGVLVLRSQWPTIRRMQRHIMSSANADLKSTEMLAAVRATSSEGGGVARWDNLRGMQVTPPGGLLDPNDPAQWQPEFFYLAKTLAIADAAGAVYAPETSDEMRLLTTKMATVPVSRRTAPTMPVLREVLQTIVPDLELDPSAAVKIRESEEAFDAWRREMRGLQREAATVSGEDLPQLVEDRLMPRISDVKSAVTGSKWLTRHAARNVGLVAITTVATAAGGAAPGPAAATGLATGVGQWLYDAYAGRRLDGSKPVIATLVRSGAR